MTARFQHGIRTRITAFVAGTCILLISVALGSWFSWSRLHSVRNRLLMDGLASTEVASHFREQMTDLNMDLLRYAVSRDRTIWEEFKRKERELEDFMDQSIPTLPSAEERHLATRLQGLTAHYWRAAERVHLMVAGSEEHSTVGGIAMFEHHAERVLAVSDELAMARGRARERFVEQANLFIEQVLKAMVGGVLLLLCFAAGLGWVIYRELIAPLRVQLIESRELAERSEKLASLGMLAAGVAHEIRNPLTAIKARLFTLRRRLSAVQDRTDAEIIDNEINRLERIVRDFLHFARPSAPNLQTVPAMETLRTVEALLAPQFCKRGVRLRVEEAPAPAFVAVDPQQIHQVLINLVQNAAEASSEGDEIVLRCRVDSMRSGALPCESVILEVQDSGAGIPPDVQARLFDPFFSTKDGGTGLGLPIASRIVDRHGGSLRFQTQVGLGTTFGIVLPIAPQPTPVSPEDGAVRP